MFTTRPTHRSMIVTALTCAALAPVTSGAAAAPPPDMHASFAQAAAAARQKQDLRTEATRNRPLDTRQQDLRHLRAGGLSAPRPLPGPPTWPVNPELLAPAPAIEAGDDGHGSDWTAIGLGIAAALLAVGGLGALARHSRVARARTTG